LRVKLCGGAFGGLFGGLKIKLIKPLHYHTPPKKIA